MVIQIGLLMIFTTSILILGGGLESSKQHVRIGEESMTISLKNLLNGSAKEIKCPRTDLLSSQEF